MIRFKILIVALFSSLTLFALSSCEQPQSGDTSWHEVGAAGQPAFQATWKNYDSSTFETVGYRKDEMGYVHLKGFADGGSVSSTIFYLPQGYRP